MQKMKVIIVGAGGHGKVVADAILKQDSYELVGFADDQLVEGTVVFSGLKVVGKVDVEKLSTLCEAFTLAIGNNKIRKEKFELLKDKLKPVTVIHPFTSIASNAVIGEGSVILAGAVINAAVSIGENCIINSMALIDHDSDILDHSHIGQACVVGSGNKLEECSYLMQNENLPSTLGLKK